jgi:transposase-like protein
MQPKSGKPARSARLATIGVELSRAAQVRLGWMDFYRKTGNVALTCRHFGISRQTFYRWLKRYEPLDLISLEERSHCPHRRRQPTWSFLLARKVLTLRLRFPRWGKD